jgi:hypothetical protein
VKIIHKVDEKFWWSVASECSYATFFHTPMWHKLALLTYKGFRDATVGTVLDNGVKLVIPFIDVHFKFNGLLRKRISTFAGCYGGMIADGPVSKVEQEKLFDAIKIGFRGEIKIIDNPLTLNKFAISEFEKSDDFTQMLFLNKNFREIFSNFSRGHKSSTSKGQRSGIESRVANSLEDYKSYYSVYEDSIRRWGVSSKNHYPWLIFANGYSLSTNYADNMKLWVAELNNQIIAGAWIFYWNKHVVYWHGASTKEYFQFRPVNVLFRDIIRDACHHGYEYFDFNPSGGHKNVVEFKRRFGSVMMPISCSVYITKMQRLVNNIINARIFPTSLKKF